MRKRELIGALIATGALASVAGADAVQDAENLFQQATAKRQSGDENGACNLFRASLQKNPNAVGTILNVALCDEKAGKFAAAYHRFEDARDRAREQSLDEHLAAAEQHLTELEGKVASITVAFVDPPTVTMQLDIDGAGGKLEGANIVDPGAHVVRVVEVKREPYSTRVVVVAGEHKAVAIPRLEPQHRGSKAVAKFLTISGVALVATATVLGYVALKRYNDAFDGGDCIKGSPSLCNANGQSDTTSARTMGNAGTIIGGLGLVTAGIGAYLWITF